ncbi:hypothetical protein BJ973_004781 [Actinoplanes tereljensis]|uniref:Uncharacterized protein n=1 Tax=Paractinoplanes tereljensis TaxID=571912 RepID=A0A919TTJ6_9ACTN|nr:hypothetical protein [Actinoplanes tereljensis]GIF21771.1 hypothetical protein Ate02nite_45010 [Actinoplanes tereljensis]
MAKPTKRQLLEAVAELLGDGPGPVETRKQTLVYGHGPIRHELSIGSGGGGGMLGWSVDAVDQEFDPLLAELGGVRVEIWRPDRTTVRAGIPGVPALYEYPWPATRAELPASVFMADVRQYAPGSVRFVVDRADLGRLLLAGDHIHRGELWASLWPNGLPGRTAKALTYARLTGDTALERRALDVLDREGDPFREAVSHFAKDYAKVSGVDLGDVIIGR